MRLEDLKIKIFADGAQVSEMMELRKQPYIQGFTTNPTLMRKAGVANYEAFGREVAQHITDLPVSFEVFSDEFDVMERQALTLSSWGKNVYVKIPITNTRGESSLPLVERLVGRGLKLNVTAMLALEQVEAVSCVLNRDVPSIVSVFAGRVADTGLDPVPVMARALDILRDNPSAELLWASPRELLNIVQADQIGCHIITATSDILRKLPILGRDLKQLSLETVKMFHDDAQSAGYTL